LTELQNLPRPCDKHLDSSSDLPLGENAEAIKLDSNVSCYNDLMQWPNSICAKRNARVWWHTYSYWSCNNLYCSQ